ncbi:aminodeoxychorismate/anthranilate synthase component II, partial [Streptococcus agalactiae]
MLLLVDNYDSFTYNLKQYLSVYKEIFVIKNDDPNLFLLAEIAEAIVLS